MIVAAAPAQVRLATPESASVTVPTRKNGPGRIAPGRGTVATMTGAVLSRLTFTDLDVVLLAPSVALAEMT